MKRILLSSTVLVAASLAVGSVPTFAGGHSKKASDTKVGDGYKNVGARAGSFTFDPTLTVEQFRDDNFYKEKSGASTKNYTKIKPEVTVKSNWGSNELRFNGGVERDQFSGSSADNATRTDARLRFRLDISKSSQIKFEGRTRNLIEERGDDNTSTDDLEPTEYQRNNYGVSAKFKPNRIGLEIGAKFNNYDYDDTAKEGGGVTNNDDRDRSDKEYNVRLGYEIQKGYEAFIRASFVDIDYDDATDDGGVNRDSDGHTIEAGIKLELSKLVDADIGIGKIKREYAESSFSDISETVANAKITWHMSPLTKVRLSVSRDINESTTSETSGNLMTSYGAGVEHEFLRNLAVTVDYKRSTNDYEDASNLRSDDKDTFEVGVDYDLNRSLSLGFKYTDEERDSNINTNDYDRKIVMVKLAGKF
jgi:hypothetical protein